MNEIYTYTFSIWPDPAIGMDSAEFQTWTFVGTQRIAFNFTEPEFIAYRLNMRMKFAIELRNIERLPYHEPEDVA